VAVPAPPLPMVPHLRHRHRGLLTERPLKPKVVVRSELRAPVEDVWAGISTLEGVNLEMAPWMRMSAPAGLDLEDAASGKVLPLDIHGPGGIPLGVYPLRLERIVEGEGFLERTRMLPFLLWQHERIITPREGGGTTVTDELGWDWRAHRLDRAFATSVLRFFEHRHRILRDTYGG